VSEYYGQWYYEPFIFAEDAMDCEQCGSTMELDLRTPPKHGLCWECASSELDNLTVRFAALEASNAKQAVEINRCREIAERDGADYSRLHGEILQYRSRLEEESKRAVDAQEETRNALLQNGELDRQLSELWTALDLIERATRREGSVDLMNINSVAKRGLSHVPNTLKPKDKKETV
jgi:hypothetical protein